MTPGDVVEWNGLEWEVDLIDDLGVHLSRHEVGGFRATRRAAPDEVTVVSRVEDTRICMGSNSQPACYKPLSECRCRR